MMKMKTKNRSPKFIALAVVCLLIGVGIGLVSYHYFLKPQSAVYEGLTQGHTSTHFQITKVGPTKEMIEKIVLLGNGKKEPIDPESEEGIGIASLLTRKLHELNLQAKCAFSKEEIQEIEQKDRSIRLFFKKPIDITISHWVEPEEGDHISVDERGYRILENVETALFILEDNLDEGLEAHVLVGHLIPPKMGSGHEKEWISYSCWAINIKEEGEPELDKSWIAEINSIIQRPKPIISVNSTVFEGERWMRLLNDGKVICYSDHYYPDYKEITIREGHISKEEIDAFLELFSNLSECSDYTVNVSEQLIGRDHMDCVFVPFGDAKISCIPLNKTLKLRLRPPSFPEPETITITAKEILKRIDDLYREAKITERKKEINPYHAKPFAVTIAYHEKALVVGAVAIIALMVGVMGFILKKRRR